MRRSRFRSRQRAEGQRRRTGAAVRPWNSASARRAGRSACSPRRRTLLDLGPTLIIVTLGPHGALLPHARRRAASFPASRSQAVDATGCGDAFIAGAALAAWSASDAGLTAAGRRRPGRDRRTAARNPALRQCRRSAHCHTPGVIPALPTAAEVEAFLWRNPDSRRHLSYCQRLILLTQAREEVMTSVPWTPRASWTRRR